MKIEKNPSQEALDQTLQRLNAGFPLLWIQSEEHGRACMSIQQLIQKENQEIEAKRTRLQNENNPDAEKYKPYQVYTWDVINGLVDTHSGEVIMPVIVGSASNSTPAYRHVLAWGNQIPDYKIANEAIILVNGFNNLMTLSTDIARIRAALLQIVRPTLREVNNNGKIQEITGLREGDCHRTVILLGPKMESPILASDVNAFIEKINFPRPNVEELQEVVKIQMEGRTTKEGIDILEDKALIHQCAEELRGTTVYQAENALMLTYVKHRKLDIQELRTQYRKIAETHPAVRLAQFEENWDNLVGFEVYKQYVEALFQPSKRVRDLKGMLFVGTPGAGKSHAAKATGNYLKWKTLMVSMGRVFQRYVGDSEENLENLLKFFNACGNAIIYIDELEKSLGGMGQGGDNGVSSRILEQFLIWMGDHPPGPFMIATANDISDKIPQELLREGRWNCIWYVPPPTLEQRVQLFDMYFNACEIQVDAKAQAEATENWTGAEIKGLAEKAETLRSILPSDEDAVTRSYDLIIPLHRKDPERFRLRMEAAQKMGVNVNETHPNNPLRAARVANTTITKRSII